MHVRENNPKGAVSEQNMTEKMSAVRTDEQAPPPENQTYYHNRKQAPDVHLRSVECNPKKETR